MRNELVSHDQSGWNEETRTQKPVRQQQDTSAEQYGKHQYRNERTREHAPDIERQSIHEHALGAALQDRRDVVQHAEH
jgi:hypothetical protein